MKILRTLAIIICSLVILCCGGKSNETDSLFAESSSFSGEHDLSGLIEIVETGSGSKEDVIIIILENMQVRQTDETYDLENYAEMYSFIAKFAEHSLAAVKNLIDFMEKNKSCFETKSCTKELDKLVDLSDVALRSELILNVIDIRRSQVNSEIEGKTGALLK